MRRSIKGPISFPGSAISDPYARIPIEPIDPPPSNLCRRENLLQFAHTEAQMISPRPESTIVRNCPAPSLGGGFLQHRIADLPLDLYEQAIAVREFDEEIGQILMCDSF